MSVWPPPGETNIAFSGAVASLMRTTTSLTIGTDGEEAVLSAESVDDTSNKNLGIKSNVGKCTCTALENGINTSPPCYECCLTIDARESFTPPPVYDSKLTAIKNVKTSEVCSRTLHIHEGAPPRSDYSISSPNDLSNPNNTSDSILPSFLIVPQ